MTHYCVTHLSRRRELQTFGLTPLTQLGLYISQSILGKMLHLLRMVLVWAREFGSGRL